MKLTWLFFPATVTISWNSVTFYFNFECVVLYFKRPSIIWRYFFFTEYYFKESVRNKSDCNKHFKDGGRSSILDWRVLGKHLLNTRVLRIGIFYSQSHGFIGDGHVSNKCINTKLNRCTGDLEYKRSSIYICLKYLWCLN